MPADYSKMKVPELRDALTARGLPTNGLKGDLISRLTASDGSASATTASTEKPSIPATTITAPAAHLPSADEEYEVDWEHDDKPAASAPTTTATTTAPAVAPTAPSAAAPAETTASASSAAAADTKPKRKTIASLFETTLSTTAKSGNEPSSPSTVTDETSSAAPAPTPAAATPAPVFSANLPTTSLDEEISRRKKRAERFGLSAEESETLKSLERQKRFGIVEEKKKEVKGLDEALPVEREKKRRGEGQPQQQGRGGKRGRFEGAAPQQQQQQQQQGGRRRGGRGIGAVVESGRVQKPAQATGGLSAEDKKRAEERRKRFAA